MPKKPSALVIPAPTAKQREAIMNLLDRLGLSSHRLSEEDLLDLGLSKMLREVDRTKRVPASEVARLLKP